MSKKVLVLTGKRGGYGAMKPMLTLLRDDPHFDLCLVATDMHLRHEFGHTVDEIKKDFPNVREEILYDTGRTAASRVWALGDLQSEMSSIFEIKKPDCLVLFGDRGESLVAATAALHMSIPIANIQGGDRTGGIDNSIRFAISAMSTYHFVSCQDSEYRLQLSSGRQRSRMPNIYIVGDLHIDAILNMNKTHEPEGGPGIIIVIYHPETGPGGFNPREGITEVLDAIFPLRIEKRKVVCIYPCSDPGYKDIVSVLEELPVGGNISVHKNMEQDDFLNLLSRADLIVGNSSCGIIEAPYLGVPAVNVGNRQRGRLRCGNTMDCGTRSHDIRLCIEAAHRLKRPFDRPYGDGHAGEKIVNILREVL